MLESSLRWRAHYLIGKPGPIYDLLPYPRFIGIEANFLVKVTQSRDRALWKQEASFSHEALGDQVRSVTDRTRGRRTEAP